MDTAILLLKNQPGKVDAIEARVDRVTPSPSGERLRSQRDRRIAGSTFVSRMLLRGPRRWDPGGSQKTWNSGFASRFHTLVKQVLRDQSPSRRRCRLVFTDGACEEVTLIGGVLFERGQRPEIFGHDERSRLGRLKGKDRTEAGHGSSGIISSPGCPTDVGRKNTR